MKKSMILFMAAILTSSCHGQEIDTNKVTSGKSDPAMQEPPLGSWKVHTEFDQDGNLIKYDSIYSWSSSSIAGHELAMPLDSIMNTVRSRFTSRFSKFDRREMENFFSQDSLFSHNFLRDPFFERDYEAEFMDLKAIRDTLLSRQQAFIERYRSALIKPEEKN